jgi:acetate kinase
VKVSLIGAGDETLAARELAAPADAGQLREALGDGLFDGADAVGHRIVHGGERFHGPVRIDAGVREALEELTELAPLHQPKSLSALDGVSSALPGTPAVACFDTAFHATLPEAAFTYALPRELRERWSVRRYGFHGLSHAWVARRAAEMTSGRANRVVSCHLGAGASLCAIADGASVDTTMGFTPLEGLVMATRSGSVDPGLLLWLLEREALTERELAEALERRSGLLGLTGSADMREILGRSDRDAMLGLEVYVHHLRAGIAAMAASLGGLDVLAFTGGVGEHAPQIRARALDGLRFLGVGLDELANDVGGGDADVSADASAVATLVLSAREDLEIAHQVRQLLGS